MYLTKIFSRKKEEKDEIKEKKGIEEIEEKEKRGIRKRKTNKIENLIQKGEKIKEENEIIREKKEQKKKRLFIITKKL